MSQCHQEITTQKYLALNVDGAPLMIIRHDRQQYLFTASEASRETIAYFP